MGPQWAATKAFWADPTPENGAEATGHLTFEGTRDQYIADVPEDVAARMPPESREENWRVAKLMVDFVGWNRKQEVFDTGGGRRCR